MIILFFFQSLTLNTLATNQIFNSVACIKVEICGSSGSRNYLLFNCSDPCLQGLVQLLLVDLKVIVTLENPNCP